MGQRLRPPVFRRTPYHIAVWPALFSWARAPLAGGGVELPDELFTDAPELLGDNDVVVRLRDLVVWSCAAWYPGARSLVVRELLSWQRDYQSGDSANGDILLEAGLKDAYLDTGASDSRRGDGARLRL